MLNLQHLAIRCSRLGLDPVVAAIVLQSAEYCLKSWLQFACQTLEQTDVDWTQHPDRYPVLQEVLELLTQRWISTTESVLLSVIEDAVEINQKLKVDVSITRLCGIEMQCPWSCTEPITVLRFQGGISLWHRQNRDNGVIAEILSYINSLFLETIFAEHAQLSTKKSVWVLSENIADENNATPEQAYRDGCLRAVFSVLVPRNSVCIKTTRVTRASTILACNLICPGIFGSAASVAMLSFPFIIGNSTKLISGNNVYAEASGFCDVANKILQHRQGVIDMLCSLSSREVSVLREPEAVYNLLIRQSLVPTLLTCQDTRQRWVQRALCRSGPENGCDDPNESLSLMNLELPRSSCTMDSMSIGWNKESKGKLFKLSIKDYIIRRVNNLTPYTIERHKRTNLSLGSAEHTASVSRRARTSVENYVLFLIQKKAYENATQYCFQKKVLDWGCNDGYGMRLLAPVAAELAGVDINAHAVVLASRRLSLQNSTVDVYDTVCHSFELHSFDVVVSFQVIEHVDDVEHYLASIKQLLKNNGILLISTPNRKVRLNEGLPPWNPFHRQEFCAATLKSLLKESFSEVKICGLFVDDPMMKVIEMNRINRHKQQQMKRVSGEVIAVCPKPKWCEETISTMTTTSLSYRSSSIDDAIDLLAVCYL